MRISTIIYVIWCNIKIWSNKLLGDRFKILPYKILINLTNNCNSKCDFCDIWKVKDFDGEVNLKDTINLFDQMGSSLVWLALSGGEVTLVKYLDSMLSEARKRCKNLKIVTFTTNALLPKKVIELSEQVKKNGFDLMVTISLDGDEALHDKVRGVPGNYKKCIELYDALKARGVNVNYGVTVSDVNESFIRNKYEEMKHSLKAVTFVHDGGIYLKNNLVNTFSVLDSMRHIVKKYSIDSISEIIELIHIKISTHFIDKNKSTNILPCEVIRTSIHIMEDGAVRPCMFMKEMGNIKSDNISDIVFSNLADDLKNQIKKDHCPHCWMNCYSPYSIMQHPFKSIKYLLKKPA
jgi:MoaA/NifB/PqqE/SkfB family radical SAM enzyme